MTPRPARRSSSSSSGLWVGLVLGGVLVAVALVGLQFAEPEPEPEQEVVEEKPKPPVAADPFANVLVDTAPAVVDPTASSLKSGRELASLRRYSRDSEWAIAVDAAALAYPKLERFRELQAQTDRFADVQPWAQDAREALAGFKKAREYGKTIERRMREDRVVGYAFEGVREAVQEWGRLEDELQRAVYLLGDE